MASQLNSLFFFLLLVSTALASHRSYHPHAPSPVDDPTTNPFEFIRTSCNATLYPDICYTTLSRYASYVRHDPAQLARIAIGVSLVQARHALSSLINITQVAEYGPDHQVTSAVHDCASLLGDTVEQMRGSLRQMSTIGSLGSSNDEAVKFQLSNVQTWMSAALTDEETCSDGFEDVADCPVKAAVCDKVGSVKELTSNALALVNSFASSVGS